MNKHKDELINLIPIFIFSGQLVKISTKCNCSKVTFELTTPSNETDYYTIITRDQKHDNWTSVTGNEFNVNDALLFDSIRITVEKSGSKCYNKMTYTGLICCLFSYLWSTKRNISEMLMSIITTCIFFNILKKIILFFNCLFIYIKSYGFNKNINVLMHLGGALI